MYALNQRNIQVYLLHLHGGAVSYPLVYCCRSQETYDAPIVADLQSHPHAQ